MKRTALVIVTFKRQELLSNLLNSITQLTQAPWRIIVVDNENSSETASLVSEFSEKVKTTWEKPLTILILSVKLIACATFQWSKTLVVPAAFLKVCA